MPGVGEVTDKGLIFLALCQNKAWADIACMLVQSRSIGVITLYGFDEGEQRTALMIAAQCNRLYVAEACIKAGADIDKAEKDGATPLCIASQKGHVDVARLLVDGGADIDKAIGKAGTSVGGRAALLIIVLLLVVLVAVIVKLLLDAFE